MTHCRFSCEKPRSVWIDGSATFTTAMSSTTMNCTVQRRASANHLRRVPSIKGLSFFSEARACDVTAPTSLLQVNAANDEATRYTAPGMAKRFDQYCPIAHALSLVGERWALLVVRELLKGPKRYTDLAAGLPGIGTNILATRLRELEAAGVVHKRKLPPPAASTVYELTAVRRRAGGGHPRHRPLGRALARHAAPRGRPRPRVGPQRVPRPLLSRARARAQETYVLTVDDDVFTVRLVDGRLRTEVGATAEAPDLAAAMDIPTFFGLASGDLAPGPALAQGLVRLEGDPAALDRCFHVFSFAPRLVPPRGTRRARRGGRRGRPALVRT